MKNLDKQYDKNKTAYNCKSVSCECIPGRMLCGAANSIDLTEWMLSKEEGPIGPSSFSCVQDKSETGTLKSRKCKFEGKNHTCY